ncbi:MAG: hypothetical protein HYZ91_05205 [Candidatus Omnitrophica bacterium]|nr:hypothetical protein [Candidatus Omnitrophota bacterium]
MGDPATDHTVYVVHCTDAEGPMCETLEATFQRLRDIFDLRLPPSRQTLVKLQRGELDLGGLEDEVARVVAPDLLAYHETWDDINAMLERITADEFRRSFPDSDGQGWVYNWFCVDHVGYTVNPRRKACGYHTIFDRYRAWLEETGGPDGLHFHFHPSHPSGAAHRCATFSFHDLKLYQVLARRIIDRHWFPSVYRAGFQTERPDSHWWLEQWIPFDLSNMASRDMPQAQLDFGAGVSGDWRRAPDDWSLYHPDHDDYQVPGRCRRVIARSLNLGSRIGVLDETEMRKAFERARRHGATLLSFSDHDFRDIGKNVLTFQAMFTRVVPDYPDVRFRYTEAREAFNRVLFGEFRKPQDPLLSVRVESSYQGSSRKRLVVESSQPTFGPQPFLAIRTRVGQYHHDNLDVQVPFRKWTYLFHDDSFQWEEIDRLGVATNDQQGFPHVVHLSNGAVEAVAVAEMVGQQAP